MEYLIAFQLLCGCFAGFVASQKDRNWFVWFLLGSAIPVAGVLMALMVEKRRPVRQEKPFTQAGPPAEPLRPPRRCCARYIPDCQGCPHFTRPLFDPTYGRRRKGYCELFKKELTEEPDAQKTRVTAEDDQGAPLP